MPTLKRSTMRTRGELGKFVSVPTTLMGLYNGYNLISQQMQQFSGRNDTTPLPAEFEKGTARCWSSRWCRAGRT